ncbi:MAG: UDP-3-O-(3-hydroxymyristoyl)glucosamine N-acyltransferase [Thermoguttaceae bacterium]|nr:UDP-3-O-(3-hydroxymyristoyl)glucosamine N-acyltransferase [Thermoguttaceae bacterium]
MKKATLSDLAALTGGTPVGDVSKEITDVAPLHGAGNDQISFLVTPKKIDLLLKSGAGAAVVPRDVVCPRCPVIQVDDVIAAFEKITLFFRPVRPTLLDEIAPTACVDPSAKLGTGVRIGPGAFVGAEVEIGDAAEIHPGVTLMAGTKIGPRTKIFPRAVLYENTVVGADCVIHAGAVLGAYGFGYDSSSAGHVLSVQYGNVMLGDHVEIGACTTIDRGTYGSTVIGSGTKIDDQVMIGHNCVIGRHNMICALTGVAGSVRTGDFVVMAGQVGVRDHVVIGDGAVLGAKAGVMGDIPAKGRYVGIPATPEKEQMRMQVALFKLHDMRKEFKDVQTKLARLVEQDQGKNE